MSTRFVYPELFTNGGRPDHGGRNRAIALRWILNPSVGLPRALFHVSFLGSASLSVLRSLKPTLTGNPCPAEGPCAGATSSYCACRYSCSECLHCDGADTWWTRKHLLTIDRLYVTLINSQSPNSHYRKCNYHKCSCTPYRRICK